MGRCLLWKKQVLLLVKGWLGLLQEKDGVGGRGRNLAGAALCPAEVVERGEAAEVPRTLHPSRFAGQRLGVLFADHDARCAGVCNTVDI